MLERDNHGVKRERGGCMVVIEMVSLSFLDAWRCLGGVLKLTYSPIPTLLYKNPHCLPPTLSSFILTLHS
jgi:hypothetical protein